MNTMHKLLLPPLVTLCFFLNPSAEVVAGDVSRSSTVSQSGKSSISQPATSRQQPKSQALQRVTPMRKNAPGYCCIEGELSKATEQICTSKRGKFFSDQKSAKRFCDTQAGFCCRDGKVDRNTVGVCKRNRGDFFIQQIDAIRKCAATKGFCCSKGESVASTKGNCDRKKGTFFTKKQEAETLCNRQKGFCCKDGKVLASTQGACTNQRGTFSLVKREVEQTCSRQTGYCCMDGKISRMTQATCKQKKGAFSLKQHLAKRICSAEKGFCCTGGKVAASTRGSCEQKKGFFATRRTEIAKKCVVAKKDVSKRIPEKGSNKPELSLQKKAPGQKGFDAPLPTKKGTQRFDEPLRQPIQTNSDHLKFTPQGTMNLDMGSGIPKVLATSKLVAKDVEKTDSVTQSSLGIGQGQAPSNVARMPDSTLGFDVRQPLQVVYIKDRMVRIGNEKNPDGLGSSLSLKNVQASFPCADASIQRAEITMPNGNNYNDLIILLNDGSMAFDSFLLESQTQFEAAHCQQSNVLAGQSTTFNITLQKSCEHSGGELVELSNTVSLPMNVYCDLRPGADPASYDPGDFKYSSVTDTLATLSDPVSQESAASVAGDQIVAVESETPLVDVSIEQPGITVSWQYSDALYVNDEMRFGNVHQSVYNASPVDNLTANVDITVGCGAQGVLKSADLFVAGGDGNLGIHQQLDSPGSGTLSNIPLMSKEQFSARYCKGDDFFIDQEYRLLFVSTYACTYPSGQEKSFEMEYITPLTITCDRRQLKATEVRTPFRHICPDGYHIAALNGQVQETTDAAGPSNPLQCIANSNN